MGASQSQLEQKDSFRSGKALKKLYKKRRVARRFKSSVSNGIPILPFNNHTLAIGVSNPTVVIDSSKLASQYLQQNGQQSRDIFFAAFYNQSVFDNIAVANQLVNFVPYKLAFLPMTPSTNWNSY
jgi:hypothetical protein